MQLTTGLIGVMTSFAIAGVAIADTKLTMEERTSVQLDSATTPQETTTQYTLWLREDRAARVSDGMRMVARLDRGETYIIDDARRTVTAIEFEGLPADIADAPEIAKTGEVQTINGWDAQRYELAIDGGIIVLWISDDVAVQMDTYRAFSRSLDGGAGLLTAIAELPGYPVLQETDLGVVKATGRLLDVSEETAPVGTYEVPAGYERK